MRYKKGATTIITSFMVLAIVLDVAAMSYMQSDDKITLNDGTEVVGSIIFKSKKLTVLMVNEDGKQIEKRISQDSIRKIELGSVTGATAKHPASVSDKDIKRRKARPKKKTVSPKQAKKPAKRKGTRPIAKQEPAEARWVHKGRWNGKGTKKTEPFTVSNEWKVEWDCKADEEELGCIFSITAYDRRTNKMIDLFANTNKSNKDSSRAYRAGTYYLDISAALCRWSVSVSSKE